MVTNGIQEPKICRVLVLISNAGRLTGIDLDGLKRMPSKVCTRCGEEKDLSEFYKEKRAKDGKTSHCKVCDLKLSREYYIKHSDVIKKRSEVYYKEHIVEILKKNSVRWSKNKAIHSERRKATYDSIRSRVRVYHREYYLKNSEVVRQKLRDYRSTPNGMLVKRKSDHKRRDIMKESETTLTSEQWNKILSNQGNKCAMCGKRFCKSRKPTIDHIIPVSKGGGLTYENVQALCKSCNCSKNSKLDYSKVNTWGVYTECISVL